MTKITNQMTVLHTEASLGWGGQEKRIMRVMAGVRDGGHRVLLACNKSSRIFSAAQKEGFTVIHRSHRSTIDPVAIAGYLAIIRREKVDIVHTHSSRDGWNGGIAARLSGRKPVVIRTRHLAGKIANPFVYKKLADKVVTVGSYMGEVFVNKYGLRRDRVQTIMTGIDLDFFDPEKTFADLRKKWGFMPEDKVLIQVAVLRGKKGHRVVLRALKRLVESGCDNIKLVIVGEGPYRPDIEKVIDELDLGDKVHMAGQQNDIPAHLANADVFCLPSFEEALGTSILEAMAMGLPAIASNTGGIPELIDESRGGLFEVDDSDGCFEMLKKTLTSDEALRAQGAKAREFARSTASVNQMVKKTLELYATMHASHR